MYVTRTFTWINRILFFSQQFNSAKQKVKTEQFEKTYRDDSLNFFIYFVDP